MIISEEQVRRAIEYLQTPQGSEPANTIDGYDIPTELLEKVREVVSTLPDYREERVEHARAIVENGGLSSEEIAAKMIGRILSDSLR